MKAAKKKQLTKAIAAYVEVQDAERSFAAYSVARALGATAEQLEAAKTKQGRSA